MRLLGSLLFCMATAAAQVAILPSKVDLAGSRASQRIIVQATFPDGHQEDVTAKSVFVVANPRVAAVEKGMLLPRGDGETTISVGTAKSGTTKSGTAMARVRVTHFQEPFHWTFSNQVLAVMTKSGCNSGACHGAAAGKNGFHLSLRGYDPEGDYKSLTPRMTLNDPASSLILRKPSFALPHGGGKRFQTTSLEYQVIADWIKDGAPPPAAGDARVTGLAIYPSEAALKPGGEQQVLVVANYSDGHTEDATRWAKYSSSDESIAGVDDGGHVKMRAPGETAVTVWYQSQVAFARLAVPYPNRVTTQAPRVNFIDDLVAAKLKALHIPASEPASDSEFLRRLSLDAAGILPSPEEAERFSSDTDPGKRKQAIAAMMDRPEFVDYLTFKWAGLPLVSSKKLPGNPLGAYSQWIRDSVAANRPWDRMVRELLTGTGSTLDHGALNFYLLHREPQDLTETYAKAFLGLSLTCARCHNHPLEKWTQNDYYQMASLFARVETKQGARAGESILMNAAAGEVNHPRLGHPLQPRPLDAPSVVATADRREALARWTTSAENPYFARAIVNRVWQNFMGRGLVDPPDDLRATNPASNEALLSALTHDFVQNGYDIRRLIVTIVSSAAYQRSSRTTPANAMDDRYFSHYLPHRLAAEVLLDAYSAVTAVPETFDGFPAGTRALQLPDSQLTSYFLSAFGRPAREITAHSERQSDASMTQALHLINGNTLNRKLATPNSRIGQMMFVGLSDSEVIEHLYLLAFSRRPTSTERDALLKPLSEARDQRRQALEDMAWALLTSKEFVFNH